jgi:hypothetical protein
MALDADKRPVDALTSNIGHCLWSGIMPPERAGRVAHHLVGETMWTLPVDGEQQAARTGQELELALAADLADPPHVPAEPRRHGALEVLHLEVLTTPGRHHQRDPDRAGGIDDPDRSLVRAHPSEEDGVLTLPGTEREAVGPHAVRHRRRPPGRRQVLALDP